MKKILDSVHGHILVDDYFITSIIDTAEFQRLRRVEQTSIRSVYPSARHDRFIHSLGVYHIGKMIVDQLQSECTYFGMNYEEFRILSLSYLAACLLHDVGHAPFSHTFEEFYGKRKHLAERLISKVNNETFAQDMTEHLDNANFHELVSAFLALEKFSDGLIPMKIDMEFVARMIVGCFYNKKPENQIKNCLISLLHGEVIDADRLDYGCRDVWASGYSTSNIDLKRLISSLHISKNDENEYVVCFDCNVINEIDNLLSVKDFQMKYVINHHTVAYDQWLLVRGLEYFAKSAFLQDMKKKHPEASEEDNVFHCMNAVCSVDSLLKDVPIGNYLLHFPTDGDFLFMMKQDGSNSYFQEWYSRNYSRFALWKSPDEFSHHFGIRRGTDLENDNFKTAVKGVIRSKYDIDDVVIKSVKYKPRVVLRSLYILIHGKTRRFSDIYPEEREIGNVIFYYVYVQKQSTNHNEIERLRMAIIEDLKPVIRKIYQ